MSYQRPTEALAQALEASSRQSFVLAPNSRRWVMTGYSILLALDDLAAPELRLAGLRFNPRSRTSNRDLYYSDLQLHDSEGAQRPVVGLPDNPRLNNLNWSPDSEWLVVTHRGADGLELWLIEFASGQARRLPCPVLNQVHGGMCVRWRRDSSGLIALTCAPDGAEPPQPPSLPAGPQIQDHRGGKAPTRTYQDLLKNPYDEQLFQYYLRSQLVLVERDGSWRPFLEAGLITQYSSSPDGRYLLVHDLQQPFSYLVPYHRFPHRTRVFDFEGQLVQTVAELPLMESIPPDFDAVRPGRRYVSWREDRDSTLVWLEALDDGDPHRPAEIRDQFSAQPIGGEIEVVLQCQGRLEAIYWGDERLGLIQEGWWRTRRRRMWRLSEGQNPQLILDCSSEDDYQNPGSPLTQVDPEGRQRLVRSQSGGFYMIGAGASPEGERPFLDEVELDGSTRRLFHSQAPYFEMPLRVVPGSGFITQRETPTAPPNLIWHCAEEVRQLTSIGPAVPELTRVSKQLLRYKRADGVELTATLYLPPDAQGPLPVLMWAYPNEFKNAAMAGQLRDSPYRYIYPAWSGPLLFALDGYAVLDDPTFPIIGEGDVEPNDTYVEQLLACARAAIDEVARLGVGDPNRVGVGGHSYGAFMTANLLAHCRWFKAGIARSGAFNRTLTPFGFQAEERTYWQAKNTYIEMSPFHWAEQIRDPLLLIHGAEDSNSGTFPLQSERMYQALKGLGGNCRLVMLPLEDHGYRARESILHALWEMQQWLTTYLKNAPPEPPST